MFSSNRSELRQYFFSAWQKYRENLFIEPIEKQIIEVILLHPEYQNLLSDPDSYQDKDFSEFNPFLHLSLHLALEEQLSTNRPDGIAALYHQLLPKFSNPHELKHRMMDCLADVLWQVQSTNSVPNEFDYLNSLKKIL